MRHGEASLGALHAPAGGSLRGAARPFAWGPVAALALLLLAVLVRAPAFPLSVIDPDESLYIVQAAAWLRGGWPYVAVWDMHPVGAPALIALVLAVVGDGVLAARLLGVVAVAGTAWLIGRAVLLCGGASAAAPAAAILYVAYSVRMGGAPTNTEILMAPFVALGALGTIGAVRRLRGGGAAPGLAVVFGIGLCFGLAVWIKQVAVPFGVVAFAALGATALLARAVAPARLLLGWLPAFGAGAALPLAATALAYAASGQLGAFVEANLTAPLRYAATQAEVLTRYGGTRMVASALATHAWLFAASAWLLALRRRRRGTMLPAAMLCWFAAGLAAILVPGKLFDHYFLLWLPPLCAMAGAALVAIGARIAGPGAGARGAVATGFVVALVASMPVLGFLAERAHAGFALRAPDPARQVAARVAAIAAPGEAVWVVNHEPIVYVLAGLAPPSRLVLPLHLVGQYGGPSAEESARELRRLVASRPDVVVYQPARTEVIAPAVRPVLDALLAHYEPVARVEDDRGMVQILRRRP